MSKQVTLTCDRCGQSVERGYSQAAPDDWERGAVTLMIGAKCIGVVGADTEDICSACAGKIRRLWQGIAAFVEGRK